MEKVKVSFHNFLCVGGDRALLVVGLAGPPKNVASGVRRQNDNNDEDDHGWRGVSNPEVKADDRKLSKMWFEDVSTACRTCSRILTSCKTQTIEKIRFSIERKQFTLNGVYCLMDTCS